MLYGSLFRLLYASLLALLRFGCLLAVYLSSGGVVCGRNAQVMRNDEWDKSGGIGCGMSGNNC